MKRVDEIMENMPASFPSPLIINNYRVTISSIPFKWYRKLPVSVEAIQLDRHFQVETLEGTHQGSPGDFLIRGVAGELYPCKPEIFAKTYEPVEDLAEGYRTALKELNPRDFRRMIEGSWESTSIEQPPPKPGRTPVGPVTRAMFEIILAEQEEKGLEKYGTPLETFNGRDPIRDAMAEVVDALQYLTQKYMEQAASFPSTEELKEAFGRDE